MIQHNDWALLHLFGAEAEGETMNPSVHTPQAIEHSGDTQAECTSAAGERNEAEAKKEGFRAMMEGEYKDLFTAYFQETFNRRFKEQKEMKEQLSSARAVADAAARCFGVDGEELLLALRTEYERRNASTSTTKESQPDKEALERQLCTAIEKTRAETEKRLLASIRARGMRPTEGALGVSSGNALRRDASQLSRAQRAEVARRAAKGERIKL